MKHHSTLNIRPFQGKHPSLGKDVLIDPSALIIGDVKIGDDASVWPMAVIRGDMHSIQIGARTSIQDGSVLHITHAGPYNPQGWPLSIGRECTIGHKVTLHGCEIGDQVLIGIGSVIMDGAVVEDKVVVGANSLVPQGKRLESGYLYLGSPAKRIRKLTQNELDYFQYSANNYVALKDRHILELDRL